jgi:hypothetical protein
MTVSKNGQLLKKEKLHDDVYEAETRVVRVGAKPKKKPSGAVNAVPEGLYPSAPTPGPGLAPAGDALAPNRGRAATHTRNKPALAADSGG